MNKLLLFLFALIIVNYSYSQSKEEISKGGYIYSSPSIEKASDKTYCPEGEKVKILEHATINTDFTQVRYAYDYGSIVGFMLIKDLDIIEKELVFNDTPKIVEVKKAEIKKVKTVQNSPKDEITIKLNKSSSGTYYIPCLVNGLKMNFIFDTGASDVSISLTEALFMIKNGYLKESDIKGTQNYSIANGDIVEGTIIIIRELEFGGIKLRNVRASISHEMQAPLLLGQSALSELGKIQIDYRNNIMTIIKD